ncbi:TRASH domain protein [Syntrophotalea carbinolica DSM 2380]|uniref:TRASH domain protein n=1 Tax=Syntrophotalea carbinolica (strain DSM 2380 / NBRC 103641 / GraBd1) TaxID=338963 RepID=Q3A7Y2_SYNC1|nr:YHS domain-containing protein [Syntrophotalea carbinolica]ABA87510.1 TRASH domain protein [Syntrophotalea carbinolica DSM 2380]
MFRFLWLFFLFLLSYYLVTAVTGLFKNATHRPPPEKRPEGEAMVRDPHCGTFIPRSLALKKVIKGQTYYFCSEECIRLFDSQETSGKS